MEQFPLKTKQQLAKGLEEKHKMQPVGKAET